MDTDRKGLRNYEFAIREGKVKVRWDLEVIEVSQFLKLKMIFGSHFASVHSLMIYLYRY